MHDYIRPSYVPLPYLVHEYYLLTMNLLSKRQQLLDAKIEKLTRDAIAKHKANNKRGALEILKLRKEVENQRKIGEICHDSTIISPLMVH